MTPESRDISLRESEEQLRHVVEAVQDLFWITNAVGDILYVSPAYETMWGRSSLDLYRNPVEWLEGVHPEDRPLTEASFRRALSGAEYRVEYRVLRPDGSMRWVKARGSPVRDEQGRVVRLAGIVEDITEWKRLEEELRRSEEHNRLISELTADYAYSARIEPDGKVVVETFTEGFTRVTGYTTEELNRLGGWPALIHPDDLHRAHETNSKLAENERVVGEMRILTKSGETRWIRYSSQMLRSVPGGQADRVVGATQDITERRLAQERLRELSHRLLEVQEQERRHLARELHDEIGQHLTALNLALDAVDRPSARDVLQYLKLARGLVKDLTAQVRDLSLRLRPTMLDDLGLIPALLWLFDRYTAQTHIRVQFEQNGLSNRFGSRVETAAYRIVQEAITNIARHTAVVELTVRAWLADAALHLSIEDCGRGFNTETAKSSGASAGLSGMQERAALLGGELNVESIPGRGTRIAATLPLIPNEGETR